MTGLLVGDAVVVSIGAILGAISRYQIGQWAATWIAAAPSTTTSISSSASSSSSSSSSSHIAKAITANANRHMWIPKQLHDKLSAFESTMSTNRQVWQGWHTAAINIGGSFLLGGIVASPIAATTSSTTATTATATATTATNTTPSLMGRPTSSFVGTRNHGVPSSNHPIINNIFVARNAHRRIISMPALTPRTKLLLGVGFCGSFTTFSTFSVDVATWLTTGQTNKAVSYLLVNNVGSILAAAAGMMLVRKFTVP